MCNVEPIDGLISFDKSRVSRGYCSSNGRAASGDDGQLRGGGVADFSIGNIKRGDSEGGAGGSRVVKGCSDLDNSCGVAITRADEVGGDRCTPTDSSKFDKCRSGGSSGCNAGDGSSLALPAAALSEHTAIERLLFTIAAFVSFLTLTSSGGHKWQCPQAEPFWHP